MLWGSLWKESAKSLRPDPVQEKKRFNYNDHVMGAGGVVALGDADPVALRLGRCLDGLPHFSGRALEIGCGAGRMVKNLKAHRPEASIQGCDISYQAIQAAAREVPVAGFAVADVQALPYTSGSFDIVVGFDIMEHVPDLHLAIDETYRVLRKGGRFHLHAPCEGNPFTVYWLLKNLGVRRDLKRIHVGHIQKLTTEGLIKDLKERGYSILDVTFSWHVLGQLVDLEQYLMMDLRSRYGESLNGFLKPDRIPAKLLWFCENLLAHLSVKESQLFKKFPFSMGIHITAQK